MDLKKIAVSTLVLLMFSGIGLAQTEIWEWSNPLPQGNELYDVCTLNDSVAVAVGELGTVIKTTDGGDHWDVQHYAGYTNGALLAVNFADALHGWCVGKNGVILATQDGGVSWVQQHRPCAVSSFRCSVSGRGKRLDRWTFWQTFAHNEQRRNPGR